MIKTRHRETVIGAGPYKLGLTLEELELINALLCVVKLGPRPYQHAAANLMTLSEEILQNQDFAIEAFEKVGFMVNIVDDNLSTKETYSSDEVIIDV